MNKNQDILDTIKLYKEYDVYKNLSKNDIAQHLIPSISLNQGNSLEAERLQESLNSEIEKFNSQLNYNRDNFNTQNSNLIEQSNVMWRRQLNQANTAGQNAVNQANAMNSFNMSNQGLSFLWQEMRDSAKWEYEAAQNAQERQTNLSIAALGNEQVSDAARASTLQKLGGFGLDLFKTILTRS